MSLDDIERAAFCIATGIAIEGQEFDWDNGTWMKR